MDNRDVAAEALELLEIDKMKWINEYCYWWHKIISGPVLGTLAVGVGEEHTLEEVTNLFSFRKDTKNRTRKGSNPIGWEVSNWPGRKRQIQLSLL